jgi:hydroxyethylthiazole kinase
VRAVGALPVMAHAKEEAGDMSKIASALVLNIGTLTNELIEAMKIAGKAANKKGIPIVLDAVGVGATKLRDDKALELLNELKIDIIKGNASEIAKLAGMEVQTKGVEATKVEANLIEVAQKLANDKKATVVLTGVEDIITDGGDVYLCKNGHDMMGSIVGTGCMAASVIGAFAAVEKDYCKAAASALVCFGIAGELASRNSTGPGSYKESFYDEIFNLDEIDIHDMEKLEKKAIVKKEAKVEEEPEVEKEEEAPKVKKKRAKRKPRKKKEQESKLSLSQAQLEKPKVEEPKIEEEPKEEEKEEGPVVEEKKEEEPKEEEPQVEEKTEEPVVDEEPEKPKEEPEPEEKKEEEPQVEGEPKEEKTEEFEAEEKKEGEPTVEEKKEEPEVEEQKEETNLETPEAEEKKDEAKSE